MRVLAIGGNGFHRPVRDRASELDWTWRVVAVAGFTGEVCAFAPPVALTLALERTTAWERAHPPPAIDPAQFDYAAEDRALASSR
jgi:hypothetical protein